MKANELRTDVKYWAWWKSEVLKFDRVINHDVMGTIYLFHDDIGASRRLTAEQVAKLTVRTAR